MPGEMLEVLEGKAAGRHIAVGDGLLIGRASDEDGRLADDPELSRQHARISTDSEGVLMVEDMGSTNGTFVNGERINGTRRLQPGDTVKVGASVLQVLDSSGRRLQPTTFSTRPSFADEPATQFDTVASTAPYQPPPPEPPRYDTPVQPPRDEPPRRDSRRLAALIAVPLVIAVVAVAAVVALSGGSDGNKPALKKTDQAVNKGDLSTADLADKAKAQSVEINTTGPEFNPDKNRVVNAKNGGTGVVVDADQGLVLTNAHVVSGATAINVQLADGTQASAVIEGEAPCEDLAVIRLRPVPTGLTAVTFGDSDAVNVGDRVVAGGYPGGFTDQIDKREFQATEGTLSQPHGRISGTVLDPVTPDGLQHQAPLRAGMSGGPLMNTKGELVGINTFGTNQTTAQNLNVAISSKRVQSLLKDLEGGKNTGYVGWSELFREPYGNDRRVLVVGRIKAGSPADKRDLAGGEVILSLDGTPVSSVPDMCGILNSKSSGDSLKVVSIPGTVWKRYNGGDIGSFLKAQKAFTTNITLE